MSEIDINRILQNIEELQNQNAIDFQHWVILGQEIEKLSGKIKTTDKHYNLLMEKIKVDYEKLKENIKTTDKEINSLMERIESDYENLRKAIIGENPQLQKANSIGCLGDSITSGVGGTSWTTKLTELCGIANVYNYGYDGSTIVTNGEYGFIDRIPSMVADLDFIVLWGGANDLIWTDQTKETFKTNFEIVVKALLDKYPKAKILGITPMKFRHAFEGTATQAWNEPSSITGLVLKDYVDIEIEIFNKYSIVYLDFFNQSGLCCDHEAQANEYFAGDGDFTHPNTEGNLKILAPKIASKINSML